MYRRHARPERIVEIECDNGYLVEHGDSSWQRGTGFYRFCPVGETICRDFVAVAGPAGEIPAAYGPPELNPARLYLGANVLYY